MPIIVGEASEVQKEWQTLSDEFYMHVGYCVAQWAD
jgi:hypothetical protein